MGDTLFITTEINYEELCTCINFTSARGWWSSPGPRCSIKCLDSPHGNSILLCASKYDSFITSSTCRSQYRAVYREYGPFYVTLMTIDPVQLNPIVNKPPDPRGASFEWQNPFNLYYSILLIITTGEREDWEEYEKTNVN